MSIIPEGDFMMGSNDGDSDEKPVHRVYISSFQMGKYEVTQSQWESVMGSNPSSFKGANRPVEQVSWDDVQKFIRKLNSQTGDHFRLPTEAEWEYAVRAGTTTPFSTGRCISTSEANYDGHYLYSGCPKGESRGKTLPVGSFSPNEFGLYDMHGNVREWVQDWYGSYSSGAATDPTGPRSGRLRGGLALGVSPPLA